MFRASRSNIFFSESRHLYVLQCCCNAVLYINDLAPSVTFKLDSILFHSEGFVSCFSQIRDSACRCAVHPGLCDRRAVQRPRETVRNWSQSGEERAIYWWGGMVYQWYWVNVLSSVCNNSQYLINIFAFFIPSKPFTLHLIRDRLFGNIRDPGLFRNYAGTYHVSFGLCRLVDSNVLDCMNPDTLPYPHFRAVSCRSLQLFPIKPEQFQCFISSPVIPTTTHSILTGRSHNAKY